MSVGPEREFLPLFPKQIARSGTIGACQALSSALARPMSRLGITTTASASQFAAGDHLHAQRWTRRRRNRARAGCAARLAAGRPAASARAPSCAVPLLLVLLLVHLVAGTTFYVDDGGDDTNDGLSSGTALLHIQRALNLSASGDTGTSPATTSSSAIDAPSFLLPSPRASRRKGLAVSLPAAALSCAPKYRPLALARNTAGPTLTTAAPSGSPRRHVLGRRKQRAGDVGEQVRQIVAREALLGPLTAALRSSLPTVSSSRVPRAATPATSFSTGRAARAFSASRQARLCAFKG